MRVHKIPSELETTITQLESYLKKQSKLQQLKPTHTRISVLKNIEMPKLKYNNFFIIIYNLFNTR